MVRASRRKTWDARRFGIGCRAAFIQPEEEAGRRRRKKMGEKESDSNCVLKFNSKTWVVLLSRCCYF